MEFALKRTQEISLLLFNLLHYNYDCTKLCIHELKETETSESRGYHIERCKDKIHSLFSSFSFLYMLKAFPERLGQRHKRAHAIKTYNIPAELSEIDIYRDANGIYKDKTSTMIDKYDELLNSPNLTTQQTVIILKMKENRMNKNKG